MNPAKLHKSLGASIASDVAAMSDRPIPIIMKLRRGPVARGEARAVSTLAGGTEYRLLDARSAVASAKVIAALTEDPAVELIWPDLPVHTWLDGATDAIYAAPAWESGFTGRGVRVAVIDTGLDGRHPDFEGRIAAWRDFVAPRGDGLGERSGHDGSGGAEPIDPNGHGTHVAGIASGSGAASGGRYKGVAPEAELVIARVLEADGTGMTSDVMAGIEWALAEGARIINISLGGAPYPADGTDALSMLCTAAVDAGAVVCAAAGNMGPAGHTIGAPGAAERVITVGASVTTPRDVDSASDSVARFSSRGPTGAGRSKPDIVFPGVGIVAPRADGTSLGDIVDGRYTALRGTSQATPMAAGAAALILQANPRATPAEVKRRLTRGADRIAGFEHNAQGSGRGNAYNAVMGAEGRQAEPVLPDPPPVEVPDARRGCLSSALPVTGGRRGRTGHRP